MFQVSCGVCFVGFGLALWLIFNVYRCCMRRGVFAFRKCCMRCVFRLCRMGSACCMYCVLFDCWSRVGCFVERGVFV